MLPGAPLSRRRWLLLLTCCSARYMIRAEVALLAPDQQPAGCIAGLSWGVDAVSVIAAAGGGSCEARGWEGMDVSCHVQVDVVLCQVATAVAVKWIWIVAEPTSRCDFIPSVYSVTTVCIACGDSAIRFVMGCARGVCCRNWWRLTPVSVLQVKAAANTTRRNYSFSPSVQGSGDLAENTDVLRILQALAAATGRDTGR